MGMLVVLALQSAPHASLLGGHGWALSCNAPQFLPPPMTGPYLAYHCGHPCSHLLPQRRIDCTDGARVGVRACVRACEQTLTVLGWTVVTVQHSARPASIHGTAWDWLCICVRCGMVSMLCHVYHTRPTPGSKELVSHIVWLDHKVCTHKPTPYSTPSLLQYQSSPHGRPPSLLPSALLCQSISSPRLKPCPQCHTTYYHPPTLQRHREPHRRTTRTVDSQRRRRSLWRPWVVGLSWVSPS